MNKIPNKLIHETSPYLKQHAYNPVEWYPWGEEALSIATKENKPILISIGYSACHWCHVMEKESFENEETARLMNENFVNIKIDREERPDLDHIYMDAVQAMTGSGGWPLNVFLTPECKPFYGGTYYPPVRAYNRPSWTEILQSVSRAFKEKRNEIDSQAESLTEYLIRANSFGKNNIGTGSFFSTETSDEIFKNIMKSADQAWGGFGSAPKFPQSFAILFLLRYYYITKNKEALKQAELSLDKMTDGGIYDHLGGGFARYSTDAEWLVPHFEKMLYDNALLISVLSEAYQLTKKKRYKEVIEETMDFIRTEMMHPEGGFYSALDADTEDEEGKFYVWDFDEVKDCLAEDADIFCEYYDITIGGNWEHKNILRKKNSLEDFAAEKNIPNEDLKNIIEKGKRKLFELRSKRVRPGLDDKIILGWNALMNSACSKAFAVTGNHIYLEMAQRNMDFLLKNFRDENRYVFFHSWKDNSAKIPAFLDDYAFLIKALINLQEASADINWLLKARQIAEFVLEHFEDKNSPFFFFTNTHQKDVIIRKKEIYDGAVPSGNSVMAYNLHYLSIVFGLLDWGEKCKSLLSSLADLINIHPTSFGNFTCLLQEISSGSHEIVILGPHYKYVHIELLKEYIPHGVIVATNKPDSTFKMLEGKESGETNSIFLCRGYVCHPPLTSINDLISLINSQIKA